MSALAQHEGVLCGKTRGQGKGAQVQRHTSSPACTTEGQVIVGWAEDKGKVWGSSRYESSPACKKGVHDQEVDERIR